MRSHLRIADLILAAAIACPAPAFAQIIRDPARQAPPPDTVIATKRDTTPEGAARLDQREFEAFRHLHLPHVAPAFFPRTCEETVGRICYWYDESKPIPKEPESIKEQRTHLISALDSLAHIVPRNIWVAEQRVRYLAEAERYQDALAAAHACVGDGAANGWRCEILVGFSLHLMGDYVAAESTYDDAVAHMDSRESCDWRNISLLLDDVALAQYRDLKCGDPARDAWAHRAWFLARTLYSMKGNDSRTEYFARMTMVRMLSDAAVAYQNGFDADERELILRFGWPRAWAAELQSPVALSMRGPSIDNGGTGGGGGSGGGGGGGGRWPPNVGGAKGAGRGGTGVGSLPPGTKVPPGVPPLVRPPDQPGTGGLPGTLGGLPGAPRVRGPRVEARQREGDGINVVGIEAFPAYRYIPAGFVLNDPPLSDSAAWRPQLPPVVGRYAPPYASTLVALEHQKAVFKRGDSAVVVMAYETHGNTAVEGAKIRAALVVTPAGSPAVGFASVRDSAPATGVLTVRAPWEPLLMSAEIAAPDRKAVARARYGIGPMRGPALRVALSDLLFYKPYSAAPTSVEEVAPHALPTERVHANEKLGVYWEAYGTDPGGEQISASLIVARENATVEDPGFFGRLGRALKLTRDATPVSVTIHDLSTRGSSTTSRGIEFDISTLTRGSYIVQLELEVAGQPTLRTEHRIEVVGP